MIALDLDALARGMSRPARFAPHEAPFWNDPHIALGMLAAHLNPRTDTATRRPDTVARIVAQLTRVMDLGPGSRLVDLGCGPGLYAAQFADLGIEVTGVDLSPGSLAHAREAAARAGHAIDYRLGDYTRDPLGGPFDAAICIYFDVGVLDDAGRDGMLDGARAALRPGGRLAFDIKAFPRRRVADGAVTVDRSDGGFWRPGPHVAIETTWHFGDDLDLTQVAVVDADGRITIYRIWDRVCRVGELRRLLGRHGFAVEHVWADLAGMPWTRASETLGIVARRR